MKQEYLRVTPTSDSLVPGDIPDTLASLHKLTHSDERLATRLNPFHRRPPIRFEFVALTEGDGEPVEFYYGADDRLDALEQRLRSIYPPTFTIERAYVDLTKKLLRPVAYSREEFETRREDGRLYEDPWEGVEPSCEPPAHTFSTTSTDSSAAGTEALEDSQLGSLLPDGDAHDVDLLVDDEREGMGGAGTVPEIEADVLPQDSADDEPVPAGEPPTTIEAEQIFARPPLDEVDPVGVQWRATASRRKDYMTTLTEFTTNLERAEAGTGRDTDEQPGQARAPLAPLIDLLVQAREPLAFSVTFQRKADWSRDARRRTGDLLAGKDTLLQTVLSIESPGARRSSTRHARHARSRHPRRDTGRATRPPSRSTSASRSQPRPQRPHRRPLRDREKDEQEITRYDLVRANTPKRTFTVNLQALALPVDDAARAALDADLDALCTVFDSLDGPYYEIEGRRLREQGRLPWTGRKLAHAALDRFQSRSIRQDGRRVAVTNRGETRTDFVLNSDELANFVVVPPVSDMTVEGARESESEPATRAPLPAPSPDLLDSFTDEGMAIAMPVDENRQPWTKPVRLPAPLLRTHVGRFAKTGVGKSIAIINDILSAYRETTGPTVLFTSKGGTLSTDLMHAFAGEFGVDELRENVLYFPVPEILPAVTVLDVQPVVDSIDALDREQAIDERVDFYTEIIKMVMGEERFADAKVSVSLLTYLIKAMFDEQHGLANGPNRESPDYFTHDQFEFAIQDYRSAGTGEPTPEVAPRAHDEMVTTKLAQHLEWDDPTFANIVGGVQTRTDHITRDDKLRTLFNNTERRFDFTKLLDEDAVVIFDLGALRDESATIMTGVLLSMLYDGVRAKRDVLAGKPETYVANVIIDEAATVASSEILTKLAERSREFKLSLELAAQFPEQLREAADEELYLNLLSNVDTTILGNLTLDDDFADRLAHESVDPVELKERLRELPNDERIVQLPPAGTENRRPAPFTAKRLPLPAGHPKAADPPPVAPDRIETAIDDVKARTQEEYGVRDSAVETLGHRAAEAVAARVGVGDADLDTVLAAAVRHVQIQEGMRETNGWVSTHAVDTVLEAAYADAGEAPPGADTWVERRKESALVEVAPGQEAPEQGGSAIPVVRLTATGEDRVVPETGDVEAAGSAAHDDLLDQLETAFIRAGFFVTIVEQDTRSVPDAYAHHPELDLRLVLEAESPSGTLTKPAKVLRNLARAHTAGDVPVFVVPAGDERADTYWAERAANILESPVKRTTPSETYYYVTTEHLTFNGGARSQGGVTACRPVVDDTETDTSPESIWWRDADDGSYVLEDETGTEHARVSSVSDASTDAVPATYSCDPADNTYTVYAQGEQLEYTSRDEFRADWVPIRRPFLPEEDLPAADYSTETYAIAMLRSSDQAAAAEATAVVYDVDAETTRPLTSLTTASLHPPAGVTDDEDGSDDTDDKPPAASQSDVGAADGDAAETAAVDSKTDASDDRSSEAEESSAPAIDPALPVDELTERAGILAFATSELEAADEAAVASRTVFEHYQAFCAMHDFPTVDRTKELTERLRTFDEASDLVTDSDGAFETGVKRLDSTDNDPARCYLDVRLRRSDEVDDGSTSGTSTSA